MKLFIVIAALVAVAATRRVTYRRAHQSTDYDAPHHYEEPHKVHYSEPASHYEIHHDDYKPSVAHVHYEDAHHSTDYDHKDGYHADEHKPVAAYQVVHHSADHDDVKYVKHDEDHLHSVDYHAKPAVYEKESHSYEEKPVAYVAPVYAAKSHEYAPRPYHYLYAVKDEASYNDYSHEQTSDDKGYVTGSYRVLLPDGRTQVVSYVADHNGYRADVKYEGVAKPYEYVKNSYKTPVYVAKEETYEPMKEIAYETPSHKESTYDKESY